MLMRVTEDRNLWQRSDLRNQRRLANFQRRRVTELFLVRGPEPVA